MSVWIVELVTNEIVNNVLEIDASHIVKLDYQNITINGKLWTLPDGVGLSFAEIRELK